MSITVPGKIPAQDTEQGKDSHPDNHGGDDSFASSACRLRGVPRKDMPNAFTKHAAASAPVSASAAPPKGEIIFAGYGRRLKPE